MSGKSAKDRNIHISQNYYSLVNISKSHYNIHSSKEVVLARIEMDGEMPKKVVDVQTGEVAVGDSNVIIKSSGIGSCIAVIALDPANHIGGIAHVMLPGESPDNSTCEKERYAHDAIDTLLSLMEEAGALRPNLVSCIAGGANVLKRPDDTVCEANIDSVKAYLKRADIPIREQRTGGTDRRRVTLNIEQNLVLHASADDSESVLLNANDEYQPDSLN